MNLLASIDEVGDSIDVRCLEFIKITEETNKFNEEILKEAFEPTSYYWKTKKTSIGYC